MWGKVSLMLIYSLMISGVFTYLLTVYVFFGKKFFCLFLISFFFSIQFYEFCIILNINSLSHMICKISHFIGCVSILLMASLLVWNVLVWCNPTCLWLLLLPLFLVSNPKKIHVKELSLCFLLGVLWFQGLHSNL